MVESRIQKSSCGNFFCAWEKPQRQSASARKPLKSISWSCEGEAWHMLETPRCWRCQSCGIIAKENFRLNYTRGRVICQQGKSIIYLSKDNMMSFSCRKWFNVQVGQWLANPGSGAMSEVLWAYLQFQELSIESSWLGAWRQENMVHEK